MVTEGPDAEVPPWARSVVGLARWAIEDGVAGRSRVPRPSPPPDPPDPPAELGGARGVFVTLLRHPGGGLRGCIGFPLPHYPLRDGVPRAARAAALHDPRFPPVLPEELDRLVVEVSVLSVPTPVPGRPEDRAEAITVGRDGLLLEVGPASGLLLPQVAPEQGWSAEEFLEGLCEKAGVPPGAWRRPGTRLLRFEAEIFRERSPRGPVVRAPAR